MAMKAKFLIIIEKGERNYSAYSPDVPGCIATGRSVETTLNEMRVALVFHIESLIESGDNVPTPKSLNYYLDKTDEISSEDILAHIEIDVTEPLRNLCPTKSQFTKNRPVRRAEISQFCFVIMASITIR